MNIKLLNHCRARLVCKGSLKAAAYYYCVVVHAIILKYLPRGCTIVARRNNTVLTTVLLCSCRAWPWTTEYHPRTCNCPYLSCLHLPLARSAPSVHLDLHLPSLILTLATPYSTVLRIQYHHPIQPSIAPSLQAGIERCPTTLQPPWTGFGLPATELLVTDFHLSSFFIPSIYNPFIFSSHRNRTCAYQQL